MTKNNCVGQDVLIDYLYGEADAGVRQRVEAHLQECRTCADESRELSQVRRTLEDWTVPAAEPGVRVPATAVVTAATVSNRWLWRRVPAWGLAAAAVLVLAAGVFLMKPEVQIGQGGMVVRFGWTDAATETGSPGSEVQAGEAAAGNDTRRASPVRRGTPVASGQTPQGRPPLAPLGDEAERAGIEPFANGRSGAAGDWRQSVQEMIRDSELRQERALVERLRQIERQMADRRQADLDEMERTFTDIGGAEAELVRQQLLDFMRRISSR
jgi:hypothetical protein